MENRLNRGTQTARRFRRFRIELIALFLLLFTASCGRGSDSGDKGGQVWIPEFLPAKLEEDAYSSIAFFGDAFYYISYERQGDGFRYRLSGYSLADSSWAEGSLTDGSLTDGSLAEGSLADGSLLEGSLTDGFLADSSLAAGSPAEGSLADGSPAGAPLPDIPLRWPDDKDRFVTTLFAMDGDGSFYLMAYVTESDGSRAHLCKFDTEGSPVYDVDISGETDSADLLAVDGLGRAYIAGRASDSPCIWLYTAEGVYRGAVYPDVSRISAMGCARDGFVYACCHDSSPDGDNSFLTEIDFENGKAGTIYPDFPKGDNSVLVPGMENSFLSYDRTSVCAYDLTAQKGQALFDWLDQGINGSYVTAVHVTEEGQILAVMRDFSSGSCELALLKKVNKAQAAQKETIVLGTLYSNSTLRNAVMAFNRESDRYHVQIREYLDPETHDQADAITRLNADILSENCPDILDIADLDLKALAAKGLFVDLNGYLEHSGRLNRSDFLDNLLDAYTMDGRLITIPSCFSMKTVFGWRGDVGEGFGWTLDELMAYEDAHPEAALFDNVSRGEMMGYLMSYNEDAFIDWSCGECRFDSDAFLRLLEFVGRFPGEAQQSPDQSSTPVRIRNGEVLLLVENISEFTSVQLPLAVYDNEGSCIGFPANDGSAGCMLIPYGAYAITAKSGQKEGAWAFLESFLASEDSTSSFFPSRKDKLAEKAADAVKPDSSDSGMAISYSDWEYDYHTPTREEVELTLRLIDLAKPVSFTEAGEVLNIIGEEAEGFYQGQKTALEAAEIIQSRVHIYVNENLTEGS